MQPLKQPVFNPELIKKAYSIDRDAEQAANELYYGLADEAAAAVIFFCSIEYDLDALSASLSRLFGDTPIIGCTTAGEISPAGYIQNSITGFSLPSKHFKIETRLIKNLHQFSAEKAKQLVTNMLDAVDQEAIAPLYDNSFALSLLDGMSIREEMVLNALNATLNGIPLVGGSAGDNLHFRDTQVYYQNSFHSNAAVIMLVNTHCPFRIFSDHHLALGQDKLVVTRADPFKRIVHEFNAEPAAIEYCRVTGLSLEELTPRVFALHPLAVQLGDQIYIRSIQQLNDDLSLTFFCAIDQGIVLTKMYSTGLVNHTHNSLNAITSALGKPQLVIGYDCIHRRIEMEDYDLLEPISALYCEHNVIGFSTYGEQHNELHINHTFTGVALGGCSEE
ncbi:MAG: GfdT protein [Gammaproteobacteria bacterium]|nr:GfdT protein [Gammaproteobacteria bacterium]